MSYVVVNLSLFVVICTAHKGFLFCNKVIIIITEILLKVALNTITPLTNYRNVDVVL